MGIPESQLERWSSIGAQQRSAATYRSIQTALAAHDWPRYMDHDVYLQGSYPNHTNIRGDSDVDDVVETSRAFYHNVAEQPESTVSFDRDRTLRLARLQGPCSNCTRGPLRRCGDY